MKESLVKLIEELNKLIESGTLSPEDVTKLINAKNHAQRALDNYDSTEDVKVAVLILQVIKVIGDFFIG